MKKMLMLLALVLALASSAVCCAAGGKILDAEEAIAEKFIAGNYKAVSTLMTADMQKDWTEQNYANFQAQVAKDFGKLTTNKLRIIEKFDDAEVLTYQIIGEKLPSARFVYIFILNGEKPLLNDFRILLPKAQEEAPAAQPQQ